MLGVVHDEDALHVELEAAGLVTLPEIERRVRRHVEEAGVIAPAFDPVVAPGERVDAVVREVLVELAIVLVIDVAFRSRPECLGVIDRFERGLRVRGIRTHTDRNGDVVRIAPHQSAQRVGVREALVLVPQVQDDTRAPIRLLAGLDAEFTLAFRFPAHAGRGGFTGLARPDFDALRDHEGGIETDAELADELGVLALIAREFLHEVGGARARDRAELAHDLVARHADAVVRDRERRRVCREFHGDSELGILGEQPGIGEGAKAQLVRRIRRVRY